AICLAAIATTAAVLKVPNGKPMKESSSPDSVSKSSAYILLPPPRLLFAPSLTPTRPDPKAAPDTTRRPLWPRTGIWYGAWGTILPCACCRWASSISSMALLRSSNGRSSSRLSNNGIFSSVGCYVSVLFFDFKPEPLASCSKLSNRSNPHLFPPPRRGRMKEGELHGCYFPPTARSCGRLPNLLPPFFVITTVSPHVQ